MDNSIESLYQEFLQSTGVSTDTRTLKKGDLFFALRGPNFNGNVYAEQALSKGAKLAVIDDPSFTNLHNTMLVDDALKELQHLALHHRRQFKGKLFALTGSNGKTTTKELLNRVLSTKYQTLATQGNLNNHIGVPLTLLKLSDETEIAIIEMGANRIGDIEELCGIAEPDLGLITNIGEAHTETFGGIAGVFKGKTEMFTFVDGQQGVIFLNVSDPRLKPLESKYPKAITYPDRDLEFLDANPNIRFKMGNRLVETQMIGAYNFQNMAAAISLGRYFEVADEQIAEAIETYVSGNLRSQVIRKGELTIIMDGYNANPTSMHQALQSFVKISGSKSLILGDMKEVEDSQRKHAEIGKYLSDYDFDKIFLVGEAMKAARDVLPGSNWFHGVEELIGHLKSEPVISGSILIKGSRSMNLDKVLPIFD